jgi:H+/Cl- antiporter ClcA
MLEEIQGYSLVEYLVAFESIILGLIASEYFVGWGEILRNRYKLKISVRPILFTILTAFVLLIHWWNIWYRANLLKDSIFQLLINFPYFILYYLLVYTQFRNFNHREKTDLKEHYLKNKNKIISF